MRGRRPVASLLAAVMLVAGATGCVAAPKDDFIEALGRPIGKIGSLSSLPANPSENEMENFITFAANELRARVTEFAYGAPDVPSFNLFYVEAGIEQPTGCNGSNGKEIKISGQEQPFLCQGILYVSINGMQLVWGKQRRAFEREGDRVVLLIHLASSLGDFYVEAIKDFAKNVFQKSLGDPNDFTGFTRCVVGSVVSGSFDTSGIDLSADYAGVPSGFGKTIADCYKAYWQ